VISSWRPWRPWRSWRFNFLLPGDHCALSPPVAPPRSCQWPRKRYACRPGLQVRSGKAGHDRNTLQLRRAGGRAGEHGRAERDVSDVRAGDAYRGRRAFEHGGGRGGFRCRSGCRRRWHDSHDKVPSRWDRRYSDRKTPRPAHRSDRPAGVAAALPAGSRRFRAVVLEDRRYQEPQRRAGQPASRGRTRPSGRRYRADRRIGFHVHGRQADGRRLARRHGQSAGPRRSRRRTRHADGASAARIADHRNFSAEGAGAAGAGLSQLRQDPGAGRENLRRLRDQDQRRPAVAYQPGRR